MSTSALVAGVLISQHHNAQNRWSILMVGDPQKGFSLFFEKKRCAHCHSIDGVGAKLAPDLGFTSTPRASISQLVSAMWNHAPRMWARIRVEGTEYPHFSNEEMSHLFAFLYTSHYADEPGDENQGQALFRDKGCVRCHSINGQGGKVGPDLTARPLDTTISWAQAMWNHAPAMKDTAQQLGVRWPRFEGREMNDLLAYVRARSKAPRREVQLLPADPQRGSSLFRTKSCITCHATGGKGGHAGPELGAHKALTIAQFSGIMWNHSPEMWRTPDPRPIGLPVQTESLVMAPLPPPRPPDALSLARPSLDGKEIADLVAFLSSLRYFEPAGSSQAGQTVFAERGCQFCHGPAAEGGKEGPRLRGRGVPTTAITLATALWQHGPKMYRRIQELGLRWPTLQESDVADIVAFLNSPIQAER